MIPTFSQIMLPLLEFYKDGEIRNIKDTEPTLAKIFNLNDTDIEEKYSVSNTTRIFFDRIGWARTFLKKAYLLEQVERGKYKITNRGKELLSTKPKEITVKTLKQYPDFWDQKSIKNHKDTEVFENSQEQTPDENIEIGYQKYRELLTLDLLEKVKQSTPAFFEKLVVDLLLAMGYGGSKGEGNITQLSRDGGIDGTIKEDKLGLDMIYIQAKKWENIVSRPEIDKFIGALSRNRAKKGVFITTSSFSKEALESVKSLDSKVVLIDGEQLVEYMIDFNVGVSIKQTFQIKRLDSDYFDEGLT